MKFKTMFPNGNIGKKRVKQCKSGSKSKQVSAFFGRF